MKNAVGIDIEEVERIRTAITMKPGVFRSRVFTEDEIKYCETKKDPYPHYTGRYAAKEALGKALGGGIASLVHLHDIEVVHEPSGKPYFRFLNKAQASPLIQSVKSASLSISHTKQYAAAVVFVTFE